MQLLWQLSSYSTLLCFALFFVLVKISEILNIGQILLSVCFVSKSIKRKIFSHHVIDQQTVNKLMLSCATKLAVPSRWETNLTLSGANQNGLKIHFISSCHIVSHYRAFSFTWPASMQIYGSKKNCLHKKSPTPTGSVWNSNIAALTSCENGLNQFIIWLKDEANPAFWLATQACLGFPVLVLQLKVLFLAIWRARDPFLESPGNLTGPESYF